MIRIGGANVADIRVGNSPIREVRIGGELAWSSKVRFVAVGHDGVMMRSSDGMSWTRFTVGEVNWNSVCFGGGKFLACGDERTIAISEDGVNWIVRNDVFRTIKGFRFVYFGKDRFWINVKETYPDEDFLCFLHSVSCEDWNHSYSSGTDVSDHLSVIRPKAMCSGNNLHVCVGECTDDSIQTQQTVFRGFYTRWPDRILYLKSENSDGTRMGFNDVCFDGTTFVSCGKKAEGKSFVATSSDGSAFTDVFLKTGSNNYFKSICNGVIDGVMRYVVMRDESEYSISDRLDNWPEMRKVLGVSASSSINGVCFGAERFVAVGDGVAVSDFVDGELQMKIVSSTPVTMNAVCFRND